MLNETPEQYLSFLESPIQSTQDLCRASLILRFLGRFQDELKLLWQYKSTFHDFSYLQERFAWHSRPIFHKDPLQSQIVPRPALHLDRQEPLPETLQSLCIVTGANSQHFPLLWELIESLKNTRSYKDIPINIIDCGLTDDEKHALFPTLSGGKIHDPGWPLPINHFWKNDGANGIQVLTKENRLKAVCNKLFLDKIFPGYTYYLYINPNFWVQDENGLDEFVRLCEKQDCAFSYPNIYNNEHSIADFPANRQFISDDESSLLMPFKKWISDAVFCVKASSSFYQTARTYLKDFVERYDGFYYYAGEIAMTKSMLKHKKKRMVDPQWFSYFSESTIHGNHLMQENRYLSLIRVPYHNEEGYFHPFQNRLGSIRFRTWPDHTEEIANEIKRIQAQQGQGQHQQIKR